MEGREVTTSAAPYTVRFTTFQGLPLRPLSTDGAGLISVSFPVSRSKETRARSLTKTFLVPLSKEEGLALRRVHNRRSEGDVVDMEMDGALWRCGCTRGDESKAGVVKARTDPGRYTRRNKAQSGRLGNAISTLLTLQAPRKLDPQMGRKCNRQ